MICTIFPKKYFFIFPILISLVFFCFFEQQVFPEVVQPSDKTQAVEQPKNPIAGLPELLSSALSSEPDFQDCGSSIKNNLYASLHMKSAEKLAVIFGLFAINEPHKNEREKNDTYDHFMGFPDIEGTMNPGCNVEYSSRHLENKILDARSLADLELLVGPKSDRTYSFAKALKRTSTEIGWVLFCDKLRKPTADVAILNKQQAVVKEFVENEKLYQAFDSAFSDLSVPESAMLSLWKEQGDPFAPSIVQRLFRPVILEFLFQCMKIPSFANILNRNPCIIEAINTFELVRSKICGSFLYGKEAFASTCDLYSLIKLWKSKPTQSEKVACDTFCNEIKNNYAERFSYENVNGAVNWATSDTFTWLASQFQYRYVGKREDSKRLEAMLTIFTKIIPAAIYFGTLPRTLRETRENRICLYERMIHIAQYLKTAEHILQLARTNEVLFKNLTVLNSLEKNLLKRSADFKKLLAILSSETFKGPASLVHYSGRVLAAYYLSNKIKDELVPLMIGLGELDAQFSIARLYKESVGARVSYCFPIYLEPEKGVSIGAVDFWNPVLGKEKVVPNTLSLGAQVGQRRNAVITGPNAGGKSTAIKALILNVIMAQTLGICAAKSFSCTPCSLIMSYNNIVDDIAAGNSHFKAGVVRAKEILDTVQNLDLKKCAVVTIDELLNGSTHNESQAAAYAFTKLLGEHSNAMLITPTHFPLLTKLEQTTPHFSNYKVIVDFDSKGKINYRYTIEPGISNQNIAFKILAEEGFDGALLKEAEEALIVSRARG